MRRKIKKQLSVFILCLLALFGLSGCIKEKFLPDENSVYLKITLECSDEISGIHVEYALAEKMLGGGVASNADSSAFQQGETIYWEFMKQDFPADADLSQLRVTLFLIDKNGKEYPASLEIAIQGEYGKIYQVNITGSYNTGFQTRYLGEAQ